MAGKGKGEKPDWLDDDDLNDQADEIIDDDDVLEDDDLFDEKSPSTPMLKRGGGTRREEPAPAKSERSERPDERRSREAEPAQKRDGGRPARTEVGHTKVVWPEDRDVMTSPLVLGLGLATIVMALLAGAYYFMIGRDTMTRELATIDEQIQGKQYQVAIVMLEQFVEKHDGKEAGPAKVRLGKVRIDQHLNSNSPDWKSGLDAFNKMLLDCKDVDKFSDEYPALVDYSKAIALGALDSASKNRSRDLVKVGDEAASNIDRFSKEDAPPVEIKKQIKIAREGAESEILRSDIVTGTYAEIDRFLKEGRPIEALASRRRLLDRYPDTVKDRKLVASLERTLQTEQQSVKIEDLKRPAEKADRTLTAPKPLSLALHTRIRADESSEGRTVWGLAGGCLYGIDTITGDIVWRRSVGLDSPYFPLPVETAVPSLLAYDTGYQEVLLLNRSTGELLWRQPLESEPTSQPLVFANQIYVTTQDHSLYRIDLGSGEITTKLKFSQAISATPTLLRDESHLVVAGHEALSYTLTLKPLACVRVVYTGHKPASIKIPLQTMGSLLLMPENDELKGAALRVLDASKSEKDLPEVGRVKLPALVKDRPVLYGNQLLVPAERELLSVYTVSDDADRVKLLPLAAPPTQSTYTGPIYVHAGPEGRFWVVSDNVKQFQLTTETLAEDAKKRIFIGAAGQPLQTIGKTLYVGRRQLESNSVSVLQVDGEDMRSYWRTVLGCGFLAIVPAANDSILCATKSGDIFQVNLAELEAGGFKFRVEGSIKLPEGLSTPLRAAPLTGGKLAIAHGGREPKVCIINQIGRVEQEIAIEQGPDNNLVALGAGVVVPLKAKLRTVGLPGVPRVDDFLSAVGTAVTRTPWTALIPLDATHIAFIDPDGKLNRLEYRTTPKPSLQSLDSIALGQPVDVPPVMDKTRMVVADASGALRVFNTARFERVAEAKLDQPAVGKMALVGNKLLVTTSAGKLECFDLDQNLKKLWSQPSRGEVIADTALLESNQLIVPMQHGAVKALKPDTGEETKTLDLAQPIEHGPFRFGKYIVVGSIDGSLYRVESVVGGQ